MPPSRSPGGVFRGHQGNAHRETPFCWLITTIPLRRSRSGMGQVKFGLEAFGRRPMGAREEERTVGRQCGISGWWLLTSIAADQERRDCRESVTDEGCRDDTGAQGADERPDHRSSLVCRAVTVPKPCGSCAARPRGSQERHTIPLTEVPAKWRLPVCIVASEECAP